MCQGFLIFIALCSISAHYCFGNGRMNSAEVADLEKIMRKAGFEQGYVYYGNDSVASEILVYRRKHAAYSYRFCIVKLPGDSIVVHTAGSIEGYQIGNKKFIKHISHGESFFIEERAKGRVGLYARDGIPSDNRFLYYLKFPDERGYLIISPHDKNISVSDSGDSRGAPSMIFRSAEIDKRFKAFVSHYMGDCQALVNMVNAGFYSINDVPSVVEVYNACFE